MTANPSKRPQRRNFSVYAFLLLFVLACDTTTFIAQPTQTPFVVTATQASSTPVTPIPSSTAGPVIPTSTGAPSCTVMQDLNLRSGPGTAYTPPIVALEDGSEFTPIGFNPQGVPGGPWVQAKVDSINKTGWVSAGTQFVSCNIELTTLPKVDVPPPAKPAPPTLGTGAVDGDGISNFRFSFDYNPQYLVRMHVFRSDDPTEVFDASRDGRDIVSVKFIVASTDESIKYYEVTENISGYCIFGGGEPDCNPWVFEDWQYKWTPGGTPVEEGNYRLVIVATATDGVVGEWRIDANIKLP